MGNAARTVTKLIALSPQRGVLTGVVLPVAVLIGGYVVVSKVTGFDPLGKAGYDVQKTIGDWWAKLTGGLGGTPVIPHIALSADSAKQGTTIGIAVDALKPSTPLLYGWKELNFSEQYTSLANGTWAGGGNGVITIAYTTLPGTYTIFVDQRQWGGPYYETKFTVLKGDNPTPIPITDYGHIQIFADPSDYVLTQDETFKFYAQLWYGSDKAPISGVSIKWIWNGNVFDQTLTNSAGLAQTRSSSGMRGALFGLGTHTIYAIAPKKDSYGSPIQDSMQVAVTQ